MAASLFQGTAVRILRNILRFQDGSEISSTTAASAVVGPASATDNAIARYDGTTGKLIQNSGASVQDDGRVTAAADATGSLDLVTKQQLDAAIQGVDVKEGTKASSTANLTLSGEQTVDGIALVTNDRILVKNQAAPAENGVYIVSSGAWSRASDANTAAELNGAFVSVSQGTSNANTGWYQYQEVVTLGTDAVNFNQFFGAGTYAADGQGIELSGSTFALELDGTTLSKSASGVKVATSGITNNEVSASAAIALTKLAATTASRALISDGSGFVSPSATTSTEISYVNGVTSAIQTQLNGKEATITTLPVAKGGTNSGTALNNNRVMQSSAGAIIESAAITASRALVSDANGIPVASSTTSTELGYVNGVTSSIQDQLNIKKAITGYITNGRAEVDTTGWAAYADAAGTSPVDGTGGSPTVTWTRSTSSPLQGAGSFLLTKDAANRQGEGASYSFSIDSADQAKVLSISFDYLVNSGTFVAGSSPSSVSDVTVWIYDVTNAVLIAPASVSLFSNSSSIADKFQTTFQSAPNSTSYRLILHVGSTSASAYALKIDNINVDAATYAFGTPVTDWKEYTPTLTGLGTATAVQVIYRRVGDSIEILGKFTAGTPTATEARASLPSGLTSASSSIIASLKVVGSGANSASTTQVFHTLIEPSVTYVTFGLANAGAAAGLAKRNGDALLNAGETFSFTALVPIAGLSSSVQTSDSVDTRVLALRASGNPASASAGNPVIFPTTDYDTHGAYNASTGRYTAPVSGYYRVHGFITSASVGVVVSAYVNASSVISLGQTDAGGECAYSGTVKVSAGDIIDVRPAGTLDADTGSTLHIERLTGPAQITASEDVNARYYASATGISGTLATIVWTTKDFDSHSGMSSGVYTVPVSGKYSVDTSLALSGTFILNNTSVIEIQKNGTAVSNVTHYIAAAVTNEALQISDVISCIAGDTIRIQVSNSGTTPAIVSSDTRNFISIARGGN